MAASAASASPPTPASSASPFLVVGQATAPHSFERRQLVRATMLADYENVASGGGTTVFRFLIGGTSDDAKLAAEMRAHADMLRVDALDGPGVDKQCACTEKTLRWLQYGLRTWPTAVYISKTEDDAYVNLRTLEMELRALHARAASSRLGERVIYGAFDFCAMPQRARRSSQKQHVGASTTATTPHGHAGCWIGRVEGLGGPKRPLTWPMTRAQGMRAQCGMDEEAMPVPFPTGQLLAASRALLDDILTRSSYTRRFVDEGFLENRRGHCAKGETSIDSWASLTCDCVFGHLMGQASLELGFNVTVAHMTLTKSHSYSWRAGHSGWTAPSRLSLVVHNLKQGALPGGPNLTAAGEWSHVHQVAARSRDPGPAPLLWSFDAQKARASGIVLTPLEEEQHAWYRATCGGAYEFRRRIEMLTAAIKGPRRADETDRDYLGGRPQGWIGWGCHPSRGHPYPQWPAPPPQKEKKAGPMQAVRATRDATLSWDWESS